MPGTANGSPSSRFARRPMWPFASANIDSVARERVEVEPGLPDRPGLDRESSAVSAHERRSERSGTTRSAPAVRSASACPRSIDSDDEPEPTRAPRCHACEGVLEDGCVGRLHAKGGGGREICIGGRLAREAVRPRVDAVDAQLEEVADPGRREDVGAVRARGDNCQSESCRLERRARSGRSPRYGSTPSPAQQVENELVLPLAEATTVVVAPASMLPRCEKGAHTVEARSPVHVPAVVRTASKGTNGSPLWTARRSRKASKVSFHAKTCKPAVSVSTPSRSKRQARMLPGKARRGFASNRRFVHRRRRLHVRERAPRRSFEHR